MAVSGIPVRIEDMNPQYGFESGPLALHVDHVALDLGSGQELGPVVHHQPALRDQIAMPVSRFDLVEQSIFFKDQEGDAKFVSFVILSTNAIQLKVTSHLIQVSADQQIKGGMVKRTWSCGSSPYFVKLRAYVTDAAGNVSRPRDYTLNC